MMMKITRRRRLSWRWAVLMLVLLWAVGGQVSQVWAAQLQQVAQALITEPASGATIRGRVSILGIATHPDFDRYELQFSPEPARGDTWSYLQHYTTRVSQVGLLHTWDTTVLSDGMYALRLRVIRRDGNFDEFIVHNLVVANALPTETPTPDATATPTPAPTTPAAPRQATPTISIELPRTETPTPQPDVAETPQPGGTTPDAGGTGLGTTDGGSTTPVASFSLGGLGRAFIQGGLYAVAAFIIVGAVFGVKRIVGWLLVRDGTGPRGGR